MRYTDFSDQFSEAYARLESEHPSATEYELAAMAYSELTDPLSPDERGNSTLNLDQDETDCHE